MWITASITFFLAVYYVVYSMKGNLAGIEYGLKTVLISAVVVTSIVSPMFWLFIKKNYFTDGVNIVDKDAKNTIKPPSAFIMLITLILSSIAAFCVKYFLSTDLIAGFAPVFFLSLIILDIYNRLNA